MDLFTRNSQYYHLLKYLIFLLKHPEYVTAIGLTPGGSSTVHIYTQTVHRIQGNGTYITIKKLRNLRNNKKKIKTNLGSAGRAPSLTVIPWHLPYSWGKSTEKPQLGQQHVRHKQTQYNTRTINSTTHRRITLTQSCTVSQNTEYKTQKSAHIK
jgi:hypothetical protein